MTGLDSTLALSLNQDWASPALDVLMGWVSSKLWFSVPILLLMLPVFTRRQNRQGMRLWLAMVICIGLGDLTGNSIKHLTRMERSCQAMSQQIRLVESPFRHGCARKPHGMPSNHSLNFFLAATMTGLLLRSWAWGLGLGLLAALVAVSRIYLGAHFPSQVLAGALLGAAMGYIMAWLLQLWVQPGDGKTASHD